MVDTASSTLVQHVLEGDNRELRMLAARGLLPLPPSELIPVTVSLAASADTELAETAAACLRSLDPRIVARHLQNDAADEVVLEYFVGHVRHPVILEALLRRRALPRRFFVELAPELPEDLQEILLLRQDAIVEEPAILDALERNPGLSAYARRRILEYREHLLPRASSESPSAPVEGEVEQEPEDEEVRLAVEEALSRPPEGEVDSLTGLSEGQIRGLAVPVRLKLARGASRTLRGILIRDSNPQVAVSVLKGNAVSDQEVEQICHNRSLCEEVFEEVGRRREWVTKYPIAKALVNNPKTPLAISLKLLGRLGVRDLREISRSRNIPDALRANADRLYKIKRQ